jgi:hypothetical protein
MKFLNSKREREREREHKLLLLLKEKKLFGLGSKIVVYFKVDSS